MDFDLTEEQKIIQETARQFAENEIKPYAVKFDRGEEKNKFLENLKNLSKQGFMGLNIKSKYGGAEAGSIAFSLVVTEIARACASTAVTISVNNMVGEVIQSVGNDDQREKYVKHLNSGNCSAASFALSEASAGSDPLSMKTKARLIDDEWIINGNKMWITSALYADFFIVWAITDTNKPPKNSISCFIVDKDTKGLEIGNPVGKMGQNASSTCELIFNNCRVKKENLLGAEGDGYRVAVRELAGGRIGIGSLALGIGFESMELAAKYATERVQFQHKIADFQAIQWMIADSFTELEASRLLLLNAAYRKDKGLPYAKEASMAKMYATESANKACYKAIQIFGGSGYTKDFPLERFYRDLRVTTIYEGTSEIQRIIIAKEVLKKFN
jgi:alkylation response protein AidB-like acyl-CoA dehydrogenase